MSNGGGKCGKCGKAFDDITAHYDAPGAAMESGRLHRFCQEGWKTFNSHPTVRDVMSKLPRARG